MNVLLSAVSNALLCPVCCDSRKRAHLKPIVWLPKNWWASGDAHWLPTPSVLERHAFAHTRGLSIVRPTSRLVRRSIFVYFGHEYTSPLEPLDAPTADLGLFYKLTSGSFLRKWAIPACEGPRFAFWRARIILLRHSMAEKNKLLRLTQLDVGHTIVEPHAQTHAFGDGRGMKGGPMREARSRIFSAY